MPTQNKVVHKAELALALALQHAASLAEQGDSKAAIANRVYDAEPGLIAQLRRPWMIARMLHILDRLERNQPSDKQMPLPIPGLTLPPRITTGKNQQHKVPLQDATLPQLLAYRRTLKKSVRQTVDRKVEQVTKLIAFMRKYAPKKRGVTVGEVLKQHAFEFVEEAK